MRSSICKPTSPTVDTTYCPHRNTKFHFGLLLLNSNFHNLKSLTSSRHCSDHSGFHFPWFRSPQAHDYHHKVNKSHPIIIIIQPACFGASCHIEMAKSPPLPSCDPSLDNHHISSNRRIFGQYPIINSNASLDKQQSNGAPACYRVVHLVNFIIISIMTMPR